MSRKEKQKSKKTLFIIMIMQLIFLILLIYSSLRIIVWAKNNKENKEIISNIEKSVEIDSTNDEENKYKVNFEKLKQENSDTVAWLKVENTNIEIPVVQAKDNSYYLTHNFNKKYNVAGWVFADYKNKFDETDKNIVVYGHNMRDDSMFGSLKNVIKEEWYDNKDNKYITFITENEYQTYQIFSIYQTEKEDYYIDLVFYNYILKCFVLIDLKTKKITHQDVGQMDMYVRMYDELKKAPDDNPTIGIVLCTETDEDIARYSVLKGNEQLFASKYKLYLPTEDELRAEIENQKTIFELQQQNKQNLDNN